MKHDVVLKVLRAARRGRDARSPSDAPAGTRLGSYEIVGEPIGEGGSGRVYPARHGERGGFFALKWAWSSLPLAEQIFLDERHKARLLNHPNILVAHDGGSHEGRPFLVFRRLEEHLTDQIRSERYADDRAILGLMRKLVGAVGFAHGRAVLHCDLKPENILFDSDHEPHIADFGLARTIEASGSIGDAWGGSLGFMSPEQAGKRSLGVQSDVFSLGVLLYWLLSGGRLPFGKGADFLSRVQEEEPEPLLPRSRFADSLAWDLAAICRRALQKQEARRYQTAAELEQDLERAADRRLPASAGSGAGARLARSTRWARRHPGLALAGFCVVVLPPYALSIQNRALGEVRAALRPQSHFSAKAQASAVVSELYGMALRVHAMARDPRVLPLLEHPGIGQVAPALQAHAAGFDSVNVFSADGVHHARWPSAPSNLAVAVLDADHFRCAERLAQRPFGKAPSDTDSALPVCVAKAHLSQLDGKVKLGLSAPLMVAGHLVGVVEASTMARDRFGALQMSCGQGDCFTALLGPRDRDAQGRGPPAALSILAQRDVAIGAEKRLPVEISREICAKLNCEPDPLHPLLAGKTEPFEIDPYLDPVSSARTLAVVAPVGRTGLSVLIATPHSATGAQLRNIAWAAFRDLWVPVPIGMVWLMLLLFAPNPRWPWPASNRVPRRPEAR